jgi:NitT/TauT family transport system permease protein
MRFKFGNRAVVPFWGRIILGMLPFLLLIFLYDHFSSQRLADNPRDKVLPSATKMYNSMKEFAVKIDRRDGVNQFREDVKASLKSLVAGVGIALILALVVGVLLGTFPFINAFLMPIVNVLSAVPPAAIVPILFMVADPGYELSILFIFMALFFVLAKDVSNQIQKIPKNLNTLLFTKGADEWEIARENLYLIMPAVLQSLKINLPLVWFALLYGETLGAQYGLGTRIFILKRFSANEIIFPYILLITFIAVALFFTLELIIKKRYPWYLGETK